MKKRDIVQALIVALIVSLLISFTNIIVSTMQAQEFMSGLSDYDFSGQEISDYAIEYIKNTRVETSFFERFSSTFLYPGFYRYWFHGFFVLFLCGFFSCIAFAYVNKKPNN